MDETSRKRIGLATFAAGVAVLLLTLWLAYGFYLDLTNAVTNVPYLTNPNASAGSPPAAVQQQPPATSANALTSQLTTAVTNQLVDRILHSLPINRYVSYFLLFALLYIFADIGFKLARLGTMMMTGGQDDASKPR